MAAVKQGHPCTYHFRVISRTTTPFQLSTYSTDYNSQYVRQLSYVPSLSPLIRLQLLTDSSTPVSSKSVSKKQVVAVLISITRVYIYISAKNLSLIPSELSAKWELSPEGVL